jgi:hypothetical protein
MKEIISSTINLNLRKNIEMLREYMSRSRYITNVMERFVLESENNNFQMENDMPVDNSLATVYQQALDIVGE